MKSNVGFQEPDRKKKIKRIITKEGLIFLAFATYFILYWYFLAQLFVEGVLRPPMFIKNLVLYSATFSYFVYLLIRFILWVIKTLKEK